MLRMSALNAATPLAQKLQSLGITISPKANTELSELVRLSQPAFEYNIQTDQNIGEFIGMVSSGTNDGDHASDHTLELNALTDQLGELVSAHIAYAKNTVKPLVVKFAENLQQYKETARPIDPSSMFNIKVLNLPDLLIDSSFLGSLEYYEGKSIIEPSGNLELEIKTEEEVRALMLPGNNRLDKLTAEWLTIVPVDFGLALWNSLFTKNGYPSVSFKTIQQMNFVEASTYALGAYLISNKLFNEVSAKGETTLSKYKTLANEYREWAGAVLTNSLTRIQTSIKNKQLVLNIDQFGKTAIVNGVIYNDWLQSGGKPEIIFGLIASGQFITLQSAIDEKAKDFEASWYSYCSYFKTIESNKVFQNFKDQLLHLFSTSFTEQDDIEKAYILKNPNIVQVATQLFAKEVDSLKLSDMDDVYGLALIAIAKCRFGYTSAYQILSDINEVGKQNPNIDVREAALLAAINYLSSYVANQIAANNG